MAAPAAFVDPFQDALDQLKALLKEGRFTEDCLDKATRLEAMLPAENDLPGLKGRCIISEIYDYFGRKERAQNVVRDGESIIKELNGLGKRKALSGARDQDQVRRFLREKARFCLDYSHAWFYRTQDYDEAIIKMNLCFSFVKDHLRDEENFPCHGTLAQAKYYLGRTYRQLSDFPKAEKAFTEAIDYYHKRATWNLEQLTSKKKKHLLSQEQFERQQAAELRFASYRSALCLLALGWVNAKKGFLSIALQNLLPAKVLLLYTQDPINSASLELILASVKRSLAGSDAKPLKACVKSITKALSKFQEHDHKIYIPWATYELALCLLQGAEISKEEISKAESIAEKLFRLAVGTEDYRSRCNADLVKSRSMLFRARNEGDPPRREKILDGALICAQTAAKLARTKKECRLSLAEAVTTVAEVKIATGNFDAKQDGRDNPEQDLRGLLNSPVVINNPKWSAVCHLLIARSLARRNLGSHAQIWYGKWKSIAAQVEDKLTHELAASVGEEIEGSLGFALDKNTTEIKHQAHDRKLKTFLVRRTEELGGTDEEQAYRLGICASSLRNWRAQLLISKPIGTKPRRRISKKTDKRLQ